MCDLYPKVKVVGQKASICDGVQSTSALGMPPTLKKLKGHIAFGLSIRRLQNLLRYSFEISYMDSSSKNKGHFFFKVWIIPLCGVMPLLKGHNEIL